MAVVRAIARTEKTYMARKKEDDNDDVFIEGIEEALDAASEEALARAADTVCKECMQIHRNENILIVTDPQTSTIGQALYEAAARISDRVLLVMMPTTHRHGDEPPARLMMWSSGRCLPMATGLS